MLTRSTLATAATIRSHLAEGALRVGRQPGEVTVASLLPTAVGETRDEALDGLRPGLAFYAGFFPRYNLLIAEHGFTVEAAAIAAAWARGDRNAAERAVSDALIDATSIAGTPQHCRERVAAYQRSGIDLPIVNRAPPGYRPRAARDLPAPRRLLCRIHRRAGASGTPLAARLLGRSVRASATSRTTIRIWSNRFICRDTVSSERERSNQCRKPKSPKRCNCST